MAWDPTKETFWAMIGFDGGAIYALQLYDATEDDLLVFAAQMRSLMRRGAKSRLRPDHAWVSPRFLADGITPDPNKAVWFNPDKITHFYFKRGTYEGMTGDYSRRTRSELEEQVAAYMKEAMAELKAESKDRHEADAWKTGADEDAD